MITRAAKAYAMKKKRQEPSSRRTLGPRRSGIIGGGMHAHRCAHDEQIVSQ